MQLDAGELSIRGATLAGVTPRWFAQRLLIGTLSTRKRDLRIQALSTQENETLVKLPQGAKVIAAPHAADGKSPFGFYKVETETNGSVVRVKTTVALTKPRISAQEYQAFRSFCEQADRALGQTLTYTVTK